MKKRSQEKRITPQAKIIRFMRLSRGISQREAARLCDLSEPAIGHYENGRMDISPLRLGQFLVVYGYSKKDFDAYLSGREIPVLNLKDECVRLLDRLNEAKLKAVHALLNGFIS